MKLITSAPKATVSYVRESRDELKKVKWPTREQTIRYTIIVVAASLVVGLITGGFDYVLAFVLKTFIL